MIIKRRIWVLFSRQIACTTRGVGRKSILSNWGAMALLYKDPSFTGFHSVSRANEIVRARIIGNFSVDGGNGMKRINARNGISLKACLEERLVQKTRAIAPLYPRNVGNDSDARLQESRTAKLVNGHEAFERGAPLSFPDNPSTQKLVVAVDVDEVLGSFVAALNIFIAERYSLNHSVSEYHVYEFFRIWKCSRDEADIRVHEFFKTPYFKSGIQPIPGARSALHKLSRFCDLSVVTSRQNVIKDLTIEWIEEHYPGLFQEIHFGNHFALDGNSRPKSEICRSLGAQILIDDNPRYALECAEVGIKVLLFDYENSYPWSKMDSATRHPLVTKVHNWHEVERQLGSWMVDHFLK